MSKKGKTSTMFDDVCLSTPFLQPAKMNMSMSTSSLMLTSPNYHRWDIRMEVTLEAHDLWGVINRNEENHKQDHLALSMILNFISESQSCQIDIKKSAKENLEVLNIFYVRMNHVVQAKVEALKREFETILMKRNEKEDDYSNQFVQIATSLRDLGENLDEYGIFSRVLK